MNEGQDGKIRYFWVDEDGERTSPVHSRLGTALNHINNFRANIERLDKGIEELQDNGAHRYELEGRLNARAKMMISGRHHGFLVYNGVPGFLRVLDDAAGTVTARDKQSLLVPYNRTGLAHGDHQPLTTVTSKDRSALVEITEEDIDQYLFRMLHWTELRKAQWMHVLPDGSVYTLEGSTYNPRTGKVKYMTDEQRVRMIGNAVSSPVAEIIGHSIAQALAQAA